MQPSNTKTIDPLAILESISDGFIFIDQQFHIQYWNQQATAMLEVTETDIIGKSVQQFLPRTLVNQLLFTAADAIEKEMEWSAEKWLLFTVHPSQLGFALTIRNVSKQKKKDRELEEIKQLFDYVLKATSEAISDYDIVNNKGFWYGENFKKLFGYNFVNEEGQCGIWEANVHPDDIDKIKMGFQEALKKGSKLFTGLYRFKRADGSYAIVKDRSYIIRDEEGNPIRAIASMEDVTNQKLIENALIENEKNYRSLFNNAPMPQWIYDMETLRILDVNDAAIVHYGYSREEFLSLKLLDLRPEEEVEKFLNYFNNSDKTGSNRSYWKHKKKDGTIILAEVKSTVVEYNNRKVRLTTINDITNEEKAKLAVLKSEENYKLLFDNAPLPQYIVKKDSLQIIKVNPAALLQYGYTEEEFLQLTPYNIRSVEDHKTLSPAIEVIEKSGEVKKMLTTHLKKSGEKLIVEVNATAIRYDEQDCYLITARNITHELHLEEKLSRLKLAAQKKITRAQIEAQEREREEIGRELHDNINQQLTTTKLYMDLAREREDLRLSLIEKSEFILNETINEIRSLSKSLIPRVLKDVGLQQALTELVDSFTAAQKFIIHLSCDDQLNTLEEELKVSIYRIVQEQMTNITKHARAANVWIDLKIDESSALLMIKDDGVGFDPLKKRTGVGISNIKNRADLYNGTVTLESVAGAGCALKVEIPLDQVAGSKLNNKIKVYVTEDDEEDQEFFKQSFSKVSPESTVVFFNNGKALMAHLQEEADRDLPDLIILDYNMPLLNGIDTLQLLHMHKRYHTIPKIVHTSSANQHHKEQSFAAFAAAYIEKGFTIAETEDNIRQMLSFASHK